MMKISIIIPAYNEENSIKELLEKVLTVDLDSLNLEKEIIVIDDGSSDATIEKIKDVQKKHKNIILLKHEKNK
ncbi:glycosyl transferase, partial [Candidatus Woesearchaeota archaeon CG10_big_fil_rev_8_21_14_0_10_34_8]